MFPAEERLVCNFQVSEQGGQGVSKRASVLSRRWPRLLLVAENNLFGLPPPPTCRSIGRMGMWYL